MNEKPKISIVTPTFNCGPFLRECIENVRAQNYPNVEHIIVDGASKDGTVEILKEYPHLTWISEPDHGEAEALNKGLRMATGDIIGWLGGDDRYLGEQVLDQVAIKAEGLTGSYVLYGKGLFINENGEAVRLHIPKIPITLAIVSRWFNGHGLFQPSMFYSNHLLRELGDFREDLPYGIDYEYWLRIAARGYSFHYVDRILGESREGGRADSKSVMAPFETRANEWTRISAGYQVALTESEQINFWKDYYSYRIKAQSQYSEVISYPEQKQELLGFAAALDLCNHLPGLRETFDRLVQRFPECEENYWLLASCLTRNGERREAEEVRAKMVMSRNRQGHGGNISPSGGMIDKKTPMPLGEKTGQSGNGGEPLVSVIIPTFNRPERLVEAVKSVLGQTYASIEILVINDGGCEVETLLSSLPGAEKIQYLRIGQNRERSYARNMGLKLANGKYIAYLDDDDRYYPTHVETLATFLESTGHHVAYSDAHRTFEIKEHEGYVRKKQDVPYSVDFNADVILRGNFIPMLSLMHAKSCIDRVGGFDETLSTHEDWELVIRLSRIFSVHHIKSVTAEFSWRTDGTSTTSQRPDDFLRTRDLIHARYREYWLHDDKGKLLEGPLSDKKERHQKSYDCSIIIPVFNRADLTEQCLTTLANLTEDVHYEVIIIDNASTDGTQKFLSSLGGDIQIIRNETNLGFAKACNQGARAARGKYLVFLNNDTIPLTGWLENLIQEVDTHQDVDVVGSKLLYPDDTVQHAGVVFCKNFEQIPYHFFSGGAKNLPAVNSRREFQAVTAACMLVRRETFEEIGGFDEGFVNGFEDVDFCLKVRELGKKVIYQPKSCLYHLESQTSGRKVHDDANTERFVSRWGRQWLIDEDIVAIESGYFMEKYVSNDKLQSRLVPKKSMGNLAMCLYVTKVVKLQQLLLGQQRQALKDMPESHEIEELLGCAEEWPSDLGVLEWVGRVCEILRCESEAQKFWEKLLTIGDHPDARVGLARAHLKKGNLEEAQKHLDVLKNEFSPEEEGWTLQGVLNMQSQDFSLAKRAFELALNFDHTYQRARIGVGMASMGLGENEGAWCQFEQVLSQDPDNLEAIRCLIQVGTVLERWEILARHLTHFIERNPADCEIRFALAGVAIRVGLLEKAKEQLSWFQLIKPDYEGLEDLGNALERAQPQEQTMSAL